jgi:hypothetical protein
MGGRLLGGQLCIGAFLKPIRRVCCCTGCSHKTHAHANLGEYSVSHYKDKWYSLYIVKQVQQQLSYHLDNSDEACSWTPPNL